MTRITNFGIKRTHVQAGFSDDDEAEKGKEKAPTDIREYKEAGDSSGPPKKKRKRDRKRKSKMTTVNHEGDLHDSEEGPDLVVASSEKRNDKRSPTSKKKKDSKEAQRKAFSENRRLRRIQDKRADTTCFVCRKKGHTAKECQTAGKNEMEEEAGRSVVGICYRCGARQHNLSRCRKPVDPFNPLPFASCFVCHKKGHLVSTCPENKEKGVYPDGGSCKLCGETSHLAKDCGLRKQDSTKTDLVLGTGKDAGADEDDFHILNRNKRDVDREEQQSTKKRKKMDVKVGVHSGLVKAFPVETRPAKGTRVASKVVNF